MSGFHHLAHKFMAENITMFYLWDLAAIEMQIRSANRGGGNTQNDIVRLLNAGIGSLSRLSLPVVTVFSVGYSNIQRVKTLTTDTARR